MLDTCQRASIFFYNKDSLHLSARVNKGESRNYSLSPSGGLQEVRVDGRIGSIRWTVDRADSTLFYGLAMDGKQGIILDNFSLRGSSGPVSYTHIDVYKRQQLMLAQDSYEVLQGRYKLAEDNYNVVKAK